MPKAKKALGMGRPHSALLVRFTDVRSRVTAGLSSLSLLADVPSNRRQFPEAPLATIQPTPNASMALSISYAWPRRILQSIQDHNHESRATSLVAFRARRNLCQLKVPLDCVVSVIQLLPANPAHAIRIRCAAPTHPPNWSPRDGAPRAHAPSCPQSGPQSNRPAPLSRGCPPA